MKKAILIINHELKQTLKRKSFIIMTAALPLLLLLGYGIYEGVQHWYHPSDTDINSIGYVDKAGGFDDYTTQLGITFIQYSSEEEAKDALLGREVREYFVIHADYLSSGLITRYTADREVEMPGERWSQMRTFLLSNLIDEEVTPQIMERALTPMMLSSFQLDDAGEIVSGQDDVSKYLLPVIFGLLLIFAIFTSSGYLFQSVTEEKENRMIEIILSSVSTRQLLVGKVIGLGAAGIIQIVVWLAAIQIFTVVASVNIPFLSGISIPASFLAWGVIYFVLGFLLFAALYAGIGSIGSNARESQGWSMIFVLPALVPLWFNYFITSNPEGVFSKVLTFFPLTAPTTTMMRLATDAISAWEIALSFTILAGSVILTLWIAAKTFRVFLLMYGKRPAIRDLVRYIREA
ncbi:MAG: ABC transporter permease [Chloroflexota bacterium]|nr:ABC transporter permease [Chloroflexota bacterium]